MRSSTQSFSKAFPLICFLVIAYIVSTIYEINVVQRLRKVIILGSYSNCSSTLSEKDIIEKTKPPEPFSNPDITILNREFYQYLASHIRDTDYSGVENYIQFNVAQSRLKPLRKIQPLQPDFGPILNDVTSYQYPIGIQSCKEITNSSTTSLFVAIISGAGYFRKREIIRQTWLRHFHSETPSKSSLAGHGFIVGLTTNRTIQIQIEKESQQYGDILQVDIIDDYYNLTLKVVGLINWLHNHCSSVNFVFKVDDDVYVNVRNLVALTKSISPTEKTIYGTKSSNNLAQRGGKWVISYDIWPWKIYPPYPTGGAVLYPGVVIKHLLAAAQAIPYVPYEDSYVNALCAEKAKIKLLYSKRVHVGEGPKLLDACHVYKSITWGTTSINHLKISHKATEDFYNGTTHCVIANSSSGLNYTVHPIETFIFPFTN